MTNFWQHHNKRSVGEITAPETFMNQVYTCLTMKYHHDDYTDALLKYTRFRKTTMFRRMGVIISDY